MTYERNPRQGQAGEETTCDITLQQPDQSSVFQDHQVPDTQKVNIKQSIVYLSLVDHKSFDKKD